MRKYRIYLANIAIIWSNITTWWNLIFFFNDKKKIIVNINITKIYATQDKIAWRFDKKGIFSEFFVNVVNKCSENSQATDGYSYAKDVWKGLVPPRVELLTWFVMKISCWNWTCYSNLRRNAYSAAIMRKLLIICFSHVILHGTYGSQWLNRWEVC